MRVTLYMTIYNRPDLLDKALESLLVKYPCEADNILLVSDGAPQEVLNVAYKWTDNDNTSVQVLECLHQGIPGINNYVTALIGSVNDVIIRMDSDFCIESKGWARKLGQFLMDHPEVGLAAPDLVGRYMRISRPGYDEIEYALGAVMAIRQPLLKDLWGFHGNGFFDEDISHQWDPDTCYRIRMLGYRIGIIDLGNCVDLGQGTGDSISASATKGGFEFLRKWNLYFTGQFLYKSPYFVRWDEFPLNYLWRRMWLAQFANPGYVQRIETIQNHRFEIVQWPVTPGKWLVSETEEALKQNLVFKGTDSLDKVDPDLLIGKRGWKPEDLQNK